jgi:hypothetical protein
MLFCRLVNNKKEVLLKIEKGIMPLLNNKKDNRKEMALGNRKSILKPTLAKGGLQKWACLASNINNKEITNSA